MHKRLLIALAMLLFAALVTFSTQTHNNAETIAASLTTSSGNKMKLTLELATTPYSRTRGLMHRKTLAPYDGMAFFFPEVTQQKFWMKNTLIPLDLLFVDEAGVIVYIGHGEPLSLDSIGPDVPVASIIEIEGGRAARSGIATGDKVHYEIATVPQNMAR